MDKLYVGVVVSGVVIAGIAVTIAVMEEKDRKKTARESLELLRTSTAQIISGTVVAKNNLGYEMSIAICKLERLYKKDAHDIKQLSSLINDLIVLVNENNVEGINVITKSINRILEGLESKCKNK